MKVPVLFLVYNRPDLTKKVLEKIATYRPERLYIAADGPKDKAGEHLIDATREAATNVSWSCKVKTLLRDKNLGCRKAVSDGVDWFFDQEEMGIILEDDCLPDTTFFTFCEELLFRYRDNRTIGMIAGTNQFEHLFKSMKQSYLFASNASIWGWASWRRAWKFYDVKMSDWPEYRNKSFLRKYTYSFLERWRRRTVYDDVYHRRINTWDYQWTFTRQKIGLLSVVPKQNLVLNIGLEEGGTHHANKSFIGMSLRSMDTPIIHPKNILANTKFDKSLSNQIISEGIIRNILYLGLKRPLLNLFKNWF